MIKNTWRPNFIPLHAPCGRRMLLEMSPEKLNVVNMSVRPQGFTECVKGESENRFEPDRKAS